MLLFVTMNYAAASPNKDNQSMLNKFISENSVKGDNFVFQYKGKVLTSASYAHIIFPVDANAIIRDCEEFAGFIFGTYFSIAGEVAIDWGVEVDIFNETIHYIENRARARLRLLESQQNSSKRIGFTSVALGVLGLGSLYNSYELHKLRSTIEKENEDINNIRDAIKTEDGYIRQVVKIAESKIMSNRDDIKRVQDFINDSARQMRVCKR